MNSPFQNEVTHWLPFVGIRSPTAWAESVAKVNSISQRTIFYSIQEADRLMVDKALKPKRTFLHHMHLLREPVWNFEPKTKAEIRCREKLLKILDDMLLIDTSPGRSQEPVFDPSCGAFAEWCPLSRDGPLKDRSFLIEIGQYIGRPNQEKRPYQFARPGDTVALILPDDSEDLRQRLSKQIFRLNDCDGLNTASLYRLPESRPEVVVDGKPLVQGGVVMVAEGTKISLKVGHLKLSYAILRIKKPRDSSTKTIRQ